MFSLMLPALLSAVSLLTTASEPVLLVQTGANSSAVSAEVVNATQVHPVSQAGQATLAIEPGTDPYSGSEWAVRFTHPFLESWDKLFLEIQFLDSGAGVLQPRLLVDDGFAGTWGPPQRAVSFTRLNTGRRRTALFEFSVPRLDWRTGTHPHLKISGLPYLLEMRAFREVPPERWRELQQGIPVEVTPLVRLGRPMRLNCTVGIPDIGNPPSLEQALDNIREYAPVAKVLGFTSVECFVRWDMIEPERGRFDFSHYDRIVEAIRRYDLKWFPNLVITSAFALPKWYIESAEYQPFQCLEHGLSNQSPALWNLVNRDHVTRVLNAFGAHYEPLGVLEAVRLGPSGNFGEAQYPAGAGGALGYNREKMHAHIGWWCGGPLAQADFQRFLRQHYASIDRLNLAWDEHYASFEEVRPRLPETYRTRQGRFDLTQWSSDSMTAWCDFWARTARAAMPSTMIYQSAGGWGYREAGTDFSALSESMKQIRGGIRLTNETDSLQQDFYATRLAATAARLYGISLGYEPAGSHSARGVAGRFFNTITTNGDNLYTRHGVLFTNDTAVARWIQQYPLLDLRAAPLIDVALYYPETMSQVDDGAFRHLHAWGFNPRAAEIRRRVDLDFLDERLIRAGFLDRYKVLVFCWGNVVDADVQQAIDQWLRQGGVVIYPARHDQETVDGATTTFRAWLQGDTGKGSFHRFQGDMEPLSLYGDYVGQVLRQLPRLHPWTQTALAVEHPDRVFVSVLENGTLLAINYDDRPVTIHLPEGTSATLAPLEIWTTVLKSPAPSSATPPPSRTEPASQGVAPERQ